MNLETINLMNANYLSKRCDNNGLYNSMLGDIEKNIIEAFVKAPHTEEEIASFEANLCGNSNIFNDGIHKSVDDVYPYWMSAKENIQIYSFESEQRMGKVA